MAESSIIAYGIDLAGYSTGKTGFAKAVRSSPTQTLVTIYRNHALAKKVVGSLSLARATQPEIELLVSCCCSGQTLIDIPIDLQNIHEPRNSACVWQLAKRPVDFVFSALPPLADKIGSPVARIQNLLYHAQNNGNEPVKLGVNLFETYPAGSLKNLSLPHVGYKNKSITFIDGQWRGETLADIANGLRFSADSGTTLNDDDVDACICAVTGVTTPTNCLGGDVLESKIRDHLTQRLPELSREVSARPPKGYKLLRCLDKGMTTSIRVEHTEPPFAV